MTSWLHSTCSWRTNKAADKVSRRKCVFCLKSGCLWAHFDSCGYINIILRKYVWRYWVHMPSFVEYMWILPVLSSALYSGGKWRQSGTRSHAFVWVQSKTRGEYQHSLSPTDVDFRLDTYPVDVDASEWILFHPNIEYDYRKCCHMQLFGRLLCLGHTSGRYFYHGNRTYQNKTFSSDPLCFHCEIHAHSEGPRHSN